MVGDVIRKEEVVSSLPQPLEQCPVVPGEPGPGRGGEDGILYLCTLRLPTEAQTRRHVHVFLHSHSSLPPACQAHGLSSPEKGGILMQEAALDGCSPPLNQSLMTCLLKCVRGLGRESESDREASLGGGTWF